MNKLRGQKERKKERKMEDDPDGNRRKDVNRIDREHQYH